MKRCAMKRCTMKHCTAFALSLSLLPSQLWAGSLQPLSESEMGDIAGQSAIELSVKLHNNIELKNDLHEGLGHCQESGANTCRLALEFAGHEGHWLVMKEFYGYLELDGIRLEGVRLPATQTDHYDATRFQREDGDCMIEDCDPSSMAAILMAYPGNKGPGVYQDMLTFMNVGRMTIEVDDGATPGFLREENPGVANAFRISDSSGPNANMQMRFDGSAMIYGF